MGNIDVFDELHGIDSQCGMWVGAKAGGKREGGGGGGLIAA